MTEVSTDIEPLEPDLWFAALAQLSKRRAEAREGGAESLLRHAFHLLQLTPRPLRGHVQCAVSEETFEALLQAGATDCAALGLVGLTAEIDLHRSAIPGTEAVEARVCLPGQETMPAAAQAQSIALALLGAWANCLLAIRRQSPAAPLPGRARHERPGESHRKSTGH